MHQTALTAAAVSLLTVASAKTIKVAVGKGGLVFSPDSVTAEKGDVVSFSFTGSVPHSVAQGDFSKGCSKVSSGGFYSGVLKSTENTFDITIENTDPIFYYCTVSDHCQDGMVGAINPSGSMTLSKYSDTSVTSSGGEDPEDVFGGTVVSGGSDSSSASSSSSVMSSSSSVMSSSSSMSMSSSSMAMSSSSMTMSSSSMMTSAPTTASTEMTSTSATTTASAAANTQTGAGAVATAAVQGIFAVAAAAAAFLV